ncbi:F0F1 ATP synthase subunit B [Clostridium thailandense]|uniref:ATP synthase subunit b n=1 Tax=Clostridium thailandense TaxID=2794346 RepID=A0A949THI2_9CLOT|nr:F0F1 ATP synthase subunit B [Clostridium thailandense]MBV7272340.1 F0F1 ATP synthase subunit B [Clostridium thailandense]MCH5135947.1 F0F1 ATP synthase subunit B [Clostridiaceae bacterium UIB06]
MEIDKIRVIITIINFGILYLILKHYFFKRVDDTITTRQEEITTKIKNTNDNEEKSKQLVLQHEELLKSSRGEGKKIVEDYKNKAEKVSSDVLKEAHEEAQTIVSRAKIEAEREKEKAADEVKNQVVDLAVLISSKALEQSIDEEQHRRLIKDFIAKVGI